MMRGEVEKYFLPEETRLEDLATKYYRDLSCNDIIRAGPIKENRTIGTSVKITKFPCC